MNNRPLMSMLCGRRGFAGLTVAAEAQEAGCFRC